MVDWTKEQLECKSYDFTDKRVIWVTIVLVKGANLPAAIGLLHSKGVPIDLAKEIALFAQENKNAYYKHKNKKKWWEFWK